MISEERKALIRNLYQEYGTYKKVAHFAGVSDKTVRKVILDLHIKDKKKPGPPPAIGQREERRISRATKQIIRRKERVTARKIQHQCGLESLHLRTVQKKLVAMGYKYESADRRITLTEKHKQRRLELARDWLAHPSKLEGVCWTDEKRFNSDGPDNWKSWMLPNEKLKRNRRQQGGPSLQVWGVLMPGPLLMVSELPPTSDSAAYMDFIESVALPAIRSTYGDDFKLQQDNAPTHSSVYSRNRFAELGIDLLEWPALSPDLNCIENVWSMLAQRVYDGPQFNSKEDLWNAIDAAVSEINSECRDALNNILASIHMRLLSVIDKKGDLTDY